MSLRFHCLISCKLNAAQVCRGTTPNHKVLKNDDDEWYDVESHDANSENGEKDLQVILSNLYVYWKTDEVTLPIFVNHRML